MADMERDDRAPTVVPKPLMRASSAPKPLIRVSDCSESDTVQVMRLVAYTRVSGRKQLDGYGLDVQKREIKAWAKANGHKIVAWFVDEAVTGSLDAADRPGLSEAITALRQRPRSADGLIVPKLDRLARAVTVQEATLALLWKEGTTVFTADSGEVHSDDEADPMRTAMRQLMGVFAELERRTIVKRMKDGRAAKKAAGAKSVGQYAYGSKSNGGKGRDLDAEPDPVEAAAISEIRRMRAAGMSYREICGELTSAGHQTRKGGPWLPATVRRIALRSAATAG